MHTLDYTFVRYTLARALHQERLDHAEDVRRGRRQLRERKQRASRNAARSRRQTSAR